MAISFKKLTEGLPCWFQPGKGEYGDIVLSSMIRMVRNLPGHPFPGWSTSEGRAAVAEAILPHLEDFPGFKNAFQAEMPKLTRQQRLILLERKQITPSMAARQDGCHYMISKDQGILAMVNEEEHLCVHAMVQGFDMKAAIAKMTAAKRHLHMALNFADSPVDGILTSLPMEAGDGLQLYSVLHLPALAGANTIAQIRKGLEKLHLTLSPFYAESGEDVGNLFVLFSPAIAMGMHPEASRHFTKICRVLAERERAMRTKNAAEESTADAVCRAYALLRHARLMDFKELLNLLSLIRLGLNTGLLAPESEEDGQDAILALHRLYNTESPAQIRALNKEIESKEDACRCRSLHAAAVVARFKPTALF